MEEAMEEMHMSSAVRGMGEGWVVVGGGWVGEGWGESVSDVRAEMHMSSAVRARMGRNSPRVCVL